MAAQTIYGRIVLLCVLFTAKHHVGAQNNGNRTDNSSSSSESNRTDISGAIPEEKLVYKKAIACESQKLYISCPDIYDRIQLKESFYGRNDFTTCKHPKLPSDKKCTEQSATVKNIVKDLCYGESQCEISVTNDFLAQSGTIICADVYKYLYVTYRCIPKSALQDIPDVPDNNGLPPPAPSGKLGPSYLPSTGAVTPVDCCYVVPGKGGIYQSAAGTVGGTITRHVGGTQSVEERIISQQSRVALGSQMPNIMEIIHRQTRPDERITWPTLPPGTTEDPNRSSGTTEDPNRSSGTTEDPNRSSGTTEDPNTSSGAIVVPTNSATASPITTNPPVTPGTTATPPGSRTNPKGLAKLRLITLLQKHAKGLGLTNLLSFDPAHLASAVANPSKKDLVPKVEQHRLSAAKNVRRKINREHQL